LYENTFYENHFVFIMKFVLNLYLFQKAFCSKHFHTNLTCIYINLKSTVI